MELVNQTTHLAYALDTLYLLLSAVLMVWIAVGFAMLEAGMVTSKSVVEVLTKNIALYAITSLVYMLVGYNLIYEGGNQGVIPQFHFFLSIDHSILEFAQLPTGTAHSKLADFFFQLLFAATSVSIVSGAVAERMKLWPFLWFAAIMAGFIYPVQAYWHWGGGFLKQWGFLDFAGSGLIHLTGACAAFTGVWILGARKNKYVHLPDGRIGVRAIFASNLPLATLGVLMLWVGWFGFNGGSYGQFNTLAQANAVALIFVNTNMAAVGGFFAALIVSRLWYGKADLTLGLNGSIAGLVAITAEPLMPTPGLASLIGMVGGILVVPAIILIDVKVKLDDPVGAIAVHGVGGILGLLAVVLSNPQAGLFIQLIGMGIILVWSLLTSTIVWLLLKYTLGIRISDADQETGADIIETGLEAYPEFVVRQ